MIGEDCLSVCFNSSASKAFRVIWGVVFFSKRKTVVKNPPKIFTLKKC